MSDTLLSAAGGSFALTGGASTLDIAIPATGGAFTLLGGTVTAPIRPSTSKPFIERCPESEQISNRLRRITEKISVCLNSLFSQSYITLDGAASYSIKSGCWSAARAPTTQDDLSAGVQRGNIWVDTNANKFYVCIDNSGFAAIWNGPY